VPECDFFFRPKPAKPGHFPGLTASRSKDSHPTAQDYHGPLFTVQQHFALSTRLFPQQSEEIPP
jgi:hypothetical protein